LLSLWWLVKLVLIVLIWFFFILFETHYFQTNGLRLLVDLPLHGGGWWMGLSLSTRSWFVWLEWAIKLAFFAQGSLVLEFCMCWQLVHSPFLKMMGWLFGPVSSSIWCFEIFTHHFLLQSGFGSRFGFIKHLSSLINFSPVGFFIPLSLIFMYYLFRAYL